MLLWNCSRVCSPQTRQMYLIGSLNWEHWAQAYKEAPHFLHDSSDICYTPPCDSRWSMSNAAIAQMLIPVGMPKSKKRRSNGPTFLSESSTLYRVPLGSLILSHLLYSRWIDCWLKIRSNFAQSCQISGNNDLTIFDLFFDGYIKPHDVSSNLP